MKLSSVFHRKKLLWMSIIVMLLVGVTMINIPSASSDTYFWVAPQVLGDVSLGQELTITIKITNAPPTYAWSLGLSWDPDLLELVEIWDPYEGRLVGVMEGDFLDRRYWDPDWGEWVYTYTTSLAFVPLAEANLEGSIMIGCSLLGGLPEGEWASGDGWLATLKFVANGEGPVHLNLFETSLADHRERGYPAYTYYPNIDGFPETVGVVEAELAKWKLKVNGKAGIGLGHETTVGTGNLLEAFVNNTGTFNVYVQVFFEIRDSFLRPIEESPIESSIEQLAPGESIVLSATWTADDPDVYYITAYLFYEFYGVVTPGGFSRTVRLRAVS